MTIDTELQTRVDTQLLEQGAFAPLEFLIDAGRLNHDDHEAWRSREIESLDDVLMGNKDKIRAQLESAVGYARGIGLVGEPRVLYAWGKGTGEHGDAPLKASTDATLDRLIASRYVPAQTAPQLDLFFDNPVVALTNGILRALSARNRGDTQRLLDRLYAQAPNHPDLGAYDRLLDALVRLGSPIEEPRAVLDYLLEIAPMAKRLLRWEAGDFLKPLWRQLAEALRGRAFSSAEPTLHRSFALIHAEDWPAAVDAVQAEPEWQLHPPLCLRLADSCFHLQRRSEALTAWFHLCWRAPHAAAAALEDRGQPDTGIKALWRRFVDDEGEGDTLTAADFPAWLLLREPGLNLKIALTVSLGNTAAERSYRTVHRWIDARRANRSADELILRKALQSERPALFRCLIKSV